MFFSVFKNLQCLKSHILLALNCVGKQLSVLKLEIVSNLSKFYNDSSPTMTVIISFKTLAFPKRIEIFLLLKIFILKMLLCIIKVNKQIKNMGFNIQQIYCHPWKMPFIICNHGKVNILSPHSSFLNYKIKKEKYKNIRNLSNYLTGYRGVTRRSKMHKTTLDTVISS